MKLKILIILSLALIVSTTAAAQKSKRTTTSKKTDAAKTDSPDAAMKQFIRAIQKKDVPSFLSFFSRTQPLRVKNYQATGDEIQLIEYADLAADLKKKGEFYQTYLGCDESDEMDCFTDSFSDRKGKPPVWKRVGKSKFITAKTDSEFVNSFQWRKENGKWVISEINYNTA